MLPTSKRSKIIFSCFKTPLQTTFFGHKKPSKRNFFAVPSPNIALFSRIFLRFFQEKLEDAKGIAVISFNKEPVNSRWSQMDLGVAV
jgi:hypothetical protein